ncbi:MAG: cupin [Proteobacteria bacterium]|nr:cupin [Pseudomonadota bacterium]
MTKHALEQFPLHLGLGARATSEPAFTGMEWYGAYSERHAADGAEGRLVSMYTFGESWTSWEMHPTGDEVVLCTAGEITLVQELPEGVKKIVLRANEYAINPRGVWHTADVAASCTAVFITAGMGTQHRAR